jgi:hypothetical protein
MKQDTSHDEGIADFAAQEDRADAKREDIEVDEGNRENKMVCIRYCGNGSQDQDEWQPRWSILDGSSQNLRNQPVWIQGDRRDQLLQLLPHRPPRRLAARQS